jgi:transcriptional regulator with XRE-family HTH domain
MIFPLRLRRIREERNLLPSDLADIVGITTGMIVKYERGGYDPPGSVLRRLADALGVTTDYLLGRSEKR